MAYMKRQKIPKNWPVLRKGTAYIVRPLGQGVPLLVVLRDMLKVAQNRKEVKKAIHLKNILLNNKPARDERVGVSLFDTITIVPSKKSYRLSLSKKGKFNIEEIKENEANKKVAKVVNKKTLKGKKVQLNLGDGRNFLSDLKCKINDSVLINFKDKKIEKCLEMKDKANVMVVAGKHAGEKASVTKVDAEKKMAELNINKNKINVLIKQIMVVG